MGNREWEMGIGKRLKRVEESNAHPKKRKAGIGDWEIGKGRWEAAIGKRLKGVKRCHAHPGNLLEGGGGALSESSSLRQQQEQRSPERGLRIYRPRVIVPRELHIDCIPVIGHRRHPSVSEFQDTMINAHLFQSIKCVRSCGSLNV